MEGQETRNGIQVIERAAGILDFLRQHPGGLSLSQLADLTGLAVSTTQRILRSLQEVGYVDFLEPRKTYKVGAGLSRLVVHSEMDIISLMKPYMDDLCEQINESVCLGSLVKGQLYVIHRAIAPRAVRVVFPPGLYPAYASASGKVLLANLRDDLLDEMLPEIVERLTPSTLTRREFLAQVPQIRQQSIAIDFGECVEEVCNCSTVINTYMGNYSLGIVTTCYRAQQEMGHFHEVLLRFKSKIEAEL